MRPLQATSLLLLAALGTHAACTSTAPGGAGGSGNTNTSCIAVGQSCSGSDPSPCCGDSYCGLGICQQCIEPSVSYQCLCDGMPNDPPTLCNPGGTCGDDGATPDGGDGGACQCVAVTIDNPCP